MKDAAKILPLAATIVLGFVSVSNAQAPCGDKIPNPMTVVSLAEPHSPAAALAAINAAHLTEKLPSLVLPAAYSTASTDQKVIMLINAERTSRGLTSYNNIQDDNDPVLAYVAANHSAVVAAHPIFWYMSPNADHVPIPHENAIDGGIEDRINGIPGFELSTVINGEGEIMAVDQNPEGAVYQWMYSDAASAWGHRLNILSCTYQYAGAGVATDLLTTSTFGSGSSVYTVDMIYSANNNYKMKVLAPGTPKPIASSIYYSNIGIETGINQILVQFGVIFHEVYGIANNIKHVYIYSPAKWGDIVNGSVLGTYPIGHGGQVCHTTVSSAAQPAVPNSDPNQMLYACVGIFNYSGVPVEIEATDMFGNTMRAVRSSEALPM